MLDSFTMPEFPKPDYGFDAETILEMERAAMDRWGKGDPDGFLEICDPDVTYFDPFQQKRFDGIEALKQLYDSLRGQVRIDRYEFVNPKVQAAGEMAVLTFNFDSWTGSDRYYWHTTEVYRRTNQGWRIIHTHWSIPQKG